MWHEPSPVMQELIAEALRQNKEVFDNPDTPADVKRVLNVQAIVIKTLDAQLHSSNEKLFYIISQLPPIK